MIEQYGLYAIETARLFHVHPLIGLAVAFLWPVGVLVGVLHGLTKARA